MGALTEYTVEPVVRAIDAERRRDYLVPRDWLPWRPRGRVIQMHGVYFASKTKHLIAGGDP